MGAPEPFEGDFITLYQTFGDSVARMYGLNFDVEAMIRSEGCRRFARLWQQWRGAELVPARAAVRPRDMPDLLPHIVIVEVRSETEAILRLVGTAMRDMTGVELTGLNWIDLSPGQERAVRGRRMVLETSHPCGGVTVTSLANSRGGFTEVEYIVFPVTPNDPDNPPQLLALIQPLARKFEMTPIEAPADLAVPFTEQVRFLDIGAGVPDDEAMAQKPTA